ncbi:lysine transporter LysE [Hanamia caeni]|jgi:threonine/homoserine/homoserine lactone efflux protein|uniref:Lysine transporter LysE n=1 Tax=Hanamia caeni TaxID=2294116 RepID=A0A3M9NHJ1_9BACT|nr:LysE family transporter [Hanamia caeni]RNI37240.1 lysine transporter LysE [Hanamia caeni]
MPLIKVFFWGMMVSFLGSLPLGTLNVAAMQISVQESVHNAILFSLGSLTVEMIYVRISLVGINWVRKQKKLFRYMEWITVAIVLALAIGSFAAAMKPHAAKNVVLNNNINRYALGAMLSAINPVQIPFWFGWSTVLFTKNILAPKNSFYNLYIVGIGIGTLLGNFVFIFGGKWIVTMLNGNQNLLNWIIGGIFTVTAIIFLIKILLHKDGLKKLEETA